MTDFYLYFGNMTYSQDLSEHFLHILFTIVTNICNTLYYYLYCIWDEQALEIPCDKTWLYFQLLHRLNFYFHVMPVL
jgi:hypothetical protein